MSPHDFVGRTIGSYRILERIGVGGMGQVYRGVHLHLDRVVAIKVLHGHLASDPDFDARFRREARAAASLEHPNIVSIHDFGEQEGLLYLVMELLTDGSVRTLVRQQPAGTWLNEVVGIDLVRQAAEGLAYAHRRGMIHRDIKPENLLLRLVEDETQTMVAHIVKVADFGLARMAEGGTMTMSGTLMGTPPYMSPEQCQGFALDPRSDQYSLGVVLYEVVTGRRPFESSTPTEAAYKHVFIEPPTPNDFRPGLDSELVGVILRALSKRPDDRFPTTADFVRALRSIQARLSQVRADSFDTPPQGLETPPQVRDSSDATVTTGALSGPATVATPLTALVSSPPAAQTMQASTPDISFALNADEFAVVPGEPLPVRAIVTNHSAVTRRVALGVRGLPVEWVRVAPTSIALNPGEQSEVDLWIDVPPDTDAVSGSYAVAVGAQLDGQPVDVATTTARIDLLPPPPPLVVVPLHGSGANRAEYEVRLRHFGRTPEQYVLQVQSESGAFGYQLDPEFVAIDAGATATASLSLEARPYRFGPAKSHPFTIVADAQQTGARREATGLFRQTGRIPLWAPALLAVVLVAAALLLSVVLGGSEPSAAAAAPQIDGVTVDPKNPVAGQPVTIYWDVVDAEQIDIRPLVTGLDPATGSYTFPNGIDGGDDLTLVATNDKGSDEKAVPLAAIAETPTPTATIPAGVTPSPAKATNTAAPTGTPPPAATRQIAPTKTPTQAATNTPPPTPTSTPEPTATNTPVSQPTNTPVPPPTNTPVPPPPPPTNTPVPPPPPPPPTNTPVPPPPPTNTPFPTPPPVTDPTEPPEYPTPPPVG